VLPATKQFLLLNCVADSELVFAPEVCGLQQTSFVAELCGQQQISFAADFLQ